VERCILGPEVRVNSYAHVSDSILFDGVQVGRHAVIRRAIIDKQVKIPERAVIGVDHELDRKRGFCVTESGIVVIGKSDSVEPGVPKSHFLAGGLNKITETR
jgi:glucose-1-phosphate adenylyltransferase